MSVPRVNAGRPATGPALVLFDLDHTLLTGDSDTLWCEFLMDRGLLERAAFQARNEDMARRYQAGTVGLQEFADFYVGTLAGRTPAQWEPLRHEFLAACILPRIPAAAMALVQRHRDEGALLVMTTATNRFLTELTALHFGIEHLLATEPQQAAGVFTGRTEGTLNMRDGKVTRLHAWLDARGARLADFHSTAYSDSVNDLPLLRAVHHAVAVDPDPMLREEAQRAGWPVLQLH